MRPTDLQQIGDELAIKWDDGSESYVKLEKLRRYCPCAGCKGEVLFGKVYKPAPLTVFQEGMYELAAIKPVGLYAIQLVWKDGHDTGIYSWEYLLALEEAIKE